ncbi:MAG: P-loop NTPase fold protein, partial [Cyanobacteria bacterium P01_A01_bin.40]
NIIENINDELVLAIDAPWGEGKTTFIKMWRGMLAQEEIQSIYFDAFENDYQEDSFLAIAAEIYSIIDDGKETIKSQFKEKTVSALKTLGRVGLRIGIKTVTAGVLDETVFEDTNTIKDVSKEASDLVDSYVSQRLDNVKQDKQNLKDFRQTLDNLASSISNNNKPLVFIIDELDRCKPPFALAILENIKHLYSVKNIVFVLVMNRTQIEESVRCEYGSGVEASKYLQKFVHLWATLPKKKDKHTKKKDKHKCDAETYLSDCLERMEFTIETPEQNEGIKLYKQLTSHYNLSLREIERSLTNYSLVHNITNGKASKSYQLIIVYLSIIKVINSIVYSKLSNNNIYYEEILLKTDLQTLEDELWLANYVLDKHPLKFLLHYCLTDRQEFEDIIKEELENFSLRDFRDILPDKNRHLITTICKWMNTFEAEL